MDTPTPSRRRFVQGGLGALGSLAVGETITLVPAEAQGREPAGQRKAERRPSGRGRPKNDYSRATVVKSVCLNCSTVCGI